MSARQDVFKKSLDQMDALTRYWTNFPAFTTAWVQSTNVHRFTSFTQDLQQLYTETFQRHLGPFLTNNRKIAERMTALTGSSDPQDLSEVRLALLSMIVESSSVGAEIWGDLARDVGHRYAQFADEYAQSLRARVDTTPNAVGREKPAVRKAAA